MNTMNTKEVKKVIKAEVLTVNTKRLMKRIKAMNKKMLVLPIVFVTWLAGCTLAPQYTRPEAPIHAEWPSGASNSTAATVS